MNEWLLAAAMLSAAMLPCLAVCLLAGPADALAAVQVASTLAATALMALAEGLHRQPFIDLALVLALLSFVGGVTFARFMESHV
jgi:multisubunit Na+/H+ antiporter MnhF subunit